MVQIGELIDGRYRVVREIGRGGAGIVYLGLHEQPGQLRAMKVLRRDGSGQTLEEELRILRSLRHEMLRKQNSIDRKVLALLPQTTAVKDAAAWLAAEAPQMTFAAPPDRLTRFKLRLYALSLRFQMLLNRNRPEKFARLERRWRTITGPHAGRP